MSKEHFFTTATSAKPEGFGELTHPPLGRQTMEINKIFTTNDRVRTLNNPTLKDKVPDWKDKTEQLALVLWNKDGVITTRLQATGYKRFDEIPAKERKGLVSLGDDGYAVEEKTMCRIVCPVRTKQCKSIFDQVMHAAGLPEGSTIESLAGRKVSVEIKAKEYGGDTFKVVTGWRQPSELKEVATADVEAEIASTEEF